MINKKQINGKKKRRQKGYQETHHPVQRKKLKIKNSKIVATNVAERK